MSDEQAATGTGSTGGEPTRSGGVPTRRALLVGAGAVGATVVLAACGTDPDEEPANQPVGGGNATAPTGESAAPGGAALAKASDVPVGGGVIVGDLVITQPTEGQFKAFSKICTHQGCPVSSIDAGAIICTCHGSKFSIEDGSVKTGPATKPLTEKKVTVDGDSITA